MMVSLFPLFHECLIDRVVKNDLKSRFTLYGQSRSSQDLIKYCSLCWNGSSGYQGTVLSRPNAFKYRNIIVEWSWADREPTVRGAWEDSERSVRGAWEDSERSVRGTWEESERKVRRVWEDSERTVRGQWEERERTVRGPREERGRRVGGAWEDSERTVRGQWEDRESVRSENGGCGVRVKSSAFLYIRGMVQYMNVVSGDVSWNVLQCLRGREV